MSFTRGFRPLNLLINPSIFCSYFLGGPSSKSMIPVAGGAHIQPTIPVHPQQISTGLTSINRTDHWKIERIIAVAMLAIIPGSFVFDSVFMNYLLAASLAIHAHWGMDTVLLDHCPRNVLRLANAIRYTITAITFAGLCYFNYNDMGLTKALKTLWALQ